MAMESDSVGVLLPKVVLPYLRQWAESSHFEVLSRLLVDDQFLSLIARYGDRLIPQPKPATGTNHANGKVWANGNGERQHQPAAGEPEFRGSQNAEERQSDLAQLYERVTALEGLLSDQQAELAAQQAMLQTVRARIRPLALALGCCPECVVGLELCPKCFGKSEVGYYEPDPESLRTLVLGPLAARGVTLSAGVELEPRLRRRARNGSTREKGE